jgi:hypothetical protein
MAVSAIEPLGVEVNNARLLCALFPKIILNVGNPCNLSTVFVPWWFNI